VTKRCQISTLNWH